MTMALPTRFEFPMPDEMAELPEEERAMRGSLEGTLATLDGKRFIRGTLPLRFREEGLEFAYECWAQVSAEAFEPTRQLLRSEHTRQLANFSGILANAPPPFESERGANVHATVPKGAAGPVFRALEGPLQWAQSAPGMDAEEHRAIVAETMTEAFTSAVESELEGAWGMATAAEEFGGTDWRRGPRSITILEFEPDETHPWRYATAGLSARPMPGSADRAEFIWEVGRRIEDARLSTALARMAAGPWHFRRPFQEGHIQPWPAGFPPESQFRSILFYDASRWEGALAAVKVFGLPVRFLCAVPIADRERDQITLENFPEKLAQFLRKRVDRA